MKVQKLQPPNHQQKLEQCEEIIKSAKRLEGLSNLKQWKEVVNWIDRRIRVLEIKKKTIECAELCEANRYIPTERELAEIKALARQIQAFEEIRDIEKSFTKEVNKALADKKKYQKRIEKQKEPKAKRKYSL